MSLASAGPVRRPTGVTALAVLTVGSGLLDAVLGVLVVLGADDTRGLRTVSTDPASARVAGAVVIGIALFQLALAVLLWKGVNASRLVLTLVLFLRFGYAWYLVGELDAQLPDGLASLVVSLVSLYLLWNARATAYFEQHRERQLANSLDSRTSLPGSRGSRRWVLDFFARLVVLSVTITLTPSISVSAGWEIPIAVVAVSAAGWALNPVLIRIAGLFGWFGALMLALFANAAVIGLGLWITPGIEVTSVAAAVLASWIYALLMIIVTWIFSISAQDYLVMHAARMSMHGSRPERSDTRGVLFVQLDGVPAPLLENEVRAGNLPTISRWIRSGTHSWTEWVARVPSTTPVSQAGLLHGDNTDIPAFRWFDRDLGRLVVANHPPDAALIESRISNGCGLLADDGVSISNLFSGDAPTSLLTMSGLRNRRAGLGPSRSYSAFFTHPSGFLRAVLLTLGEMVKELFQARRQVRRGVVPRIDRGGSYVALRGVTNVFLRDLNVALIVEAMMRGAKSIYVDFVDYDEIAHHAGVTRPESLASLYGLDDVLRSLEALANGGATPRPYDIVLVSDHGQSQGATFRQRYGQSLEEVVGTYMHGDTDVTAATQEVEAWGPVNVFLSQLSGQESVSGRIAKRVLSDRDPDSALGPATEDRKATSDVPDTDKAPLVVVGSGNLGGIWFAQHPRRLALHEIEERHPGLVQALADHEGIGFVVVLTVAGPIAVGARGTRDLASGEVSGTDPLSGFGPDAAADFLRAARFDHAPDIYVNSLYDPVLDEVAAFEELVGCHGGLGGWQTRPILVFPSGWSLDDDLLDDRGRLYGADAVHRQLVRWLERLGHRGDLPSDAKQLSER